MQIAKENDL